MIESAKLLPKSQLLLGKLFGKVKCWVARKHRQILEDCVFHVYLSIFPFANLSILLS